MNHYHRQQTNSQAVIIGGSMAGLLAARVLSEQVDSVVIIEKDRLADKPAPRQGVPQSYQTHSIHQKGAEILQQLFPDLGWDFANSGVVPCDLGSEMRWFFYGDWMTPSPSNVFVHWCDRPQLEWQIRQRVLALPNVRLLDGHKVLSLLMDDAQERVVGVTVNSKRLPQQIEHIPASMIVDAGGRGSRINRWIQEQGYEKAPQSEVKINLGYASGYFQLPEDYQADWKALLISAKPGLSHKLGLIYRMPNNQIKVLLAGWFGDHPPTNLEDYLDFAQSLPQPDVYDILLVAKPLMPIKAYRMPSNKWHHYEKMARWPGGLFVMGDAVCSFNPSFGQGMTVAALHAVALGEQVGAAVNNGRNLSHPRLARAFQKKAARIVNNPWMITTGEDLRFPEAEGPRPRSLPIAQAYLAQVFDVAHRNPAVARRFFEVMTSMKEPPALFHPTVVLSVLGNLLRRGAAKIGRRPSPAQPLAAQAVRPAGGIDA